MIDLIKILFDPGRVFHALDERFNNRELNAIKNGVNLDEERKRSIHYFSKQFNQNVESYLQEYRTSDFRKEYFQKIELIRKKFKGGDWASSDFDCETLYLLVRCMKPKVVLETGMLFGSFTSHILEAMRKNDVGKLYSLELNQELFPGVMAGSIIPSNLSIRHEIIYGDCRKTLPEICSKLQNIDLFVHDSIHTFDHMMWEYLSVHQYMKAGSIISSHDVIATRYRPNAFNVFASAFHYPSQIFMNFGVLQVVTTTPKT